MMSPFHVLLGLAVSVMTSQGAPAIQVVDLTHPVSERTLFWPGQPRFNFTILHRGYTQEYKTWMESNYFAMAEHGGTHIDAPAHFAQSRWRTHQIPASRLIGPGVVVDVRNRVTGNADYAATVDDVKLWEEQYGQIPEGAVVILRTGWGRRYPDARLTFNSQSPQDPKTFHFPGFHEDTARWLATERNIVAVGTDTPSPELGINVGRTLPVHKVLLERDIILLENLANLEHLPNHGTTIVIGVLNLVDGSGGPARIMGLFGPGADAMYAARSTSAAREISASLVFSVALAALILKL